MAEEVQSDLSEALRWLRERIGVSREQLAAASGVSAVHIKFIERGKRNPSEAVVQRLLPALRVTRHDLDGLLSLRPWASSTASGEAATLSTYAAGVPLVVAEGSEFEAAPAPTAPPAPLAPLAQPMAGAGMRATVAHRTRRQSPRLGAYAASSTAAPQPSAPPAPSAPEPQSEPTTLDAELIELRERYVHLPRSNQEMVLGWLRALDDR
jgi:transcriptional regulator with XRE-family HTH domain